MQENKLARCIMVLGTSSGAGKSWLATALCRYFSNQGLRVAPFKAQNMSNNARVVATPDGSYGEIGSAQYFQALAARTTPDVRMNPLLLKPEADTRSQVVLNGKVNNRLTELPWRGRSEKVWPHITAALDSLRAENDVVVIEGAGSPAEINLHASDIVNMRVAVHCQADCLLVADIDRGGAFAHLYGTWALLPDDEPVSERKLIKGFVLNKFRGDAALLHPAPQMLEEKTGVPVVGVVPMRFGHGLPEEDGVFDDGASVTASASAPSAGSAVHTRIAVVAYPRMSNLDEFQPLKNVAGVSLRWVRSPAGLQGVDWVILPGSKATVADLQWLRQQGLDAAIAEHARAGGRVLGVCGGLQMLGEAIVDTGAVESSAISAIDNNAPGLGLLPLVTQFAPVKTVRPAAAAFGELTGAWSALRGVRVSGYEIHHGQTMQHPAMAAAGDVAREVMPQTAWQNAAGNVLGVYLHGLFEDGYVLRALFGANAQTLDAVFENLSREARQAGVTDCVLQWAGMQ